MSLQTKHLMAIFLPATALAAVAVFVQVLRYAPTSADMAVKQSDQTPNTAGVTIFTDDPIIGKRAAAQTLIAFADIACYRCQADLQIIASLAAQYPKKIKMIWKGLPVTRLPYPSDSANAYAYCANQQGKFLPFAEAIIQIGSDSLTEEATKAAAQAADLSESNLTACLSSGLAAAYQKRVEALARDLNIQTTPTVFFNQKQIDPPTTLEGWQTLLGL